MKKLFAVVVFAVFACSPFLFTACTLGGITETNTVIYTDNLEAGINLALRSSVLIQTNRGSGSGVIYEIDGANMYVITNWHVICEDAENNDTRPVGYYAVSPASALEINNGGFAVNPSYRAETNSVGYAADEDDVQLIGGSSYYDIAILKVTNTDLIDRFDFLPAQVFNGRLAYGSAAFAIGNSLGQGISATDGVVSIPSEYVIDNDIMADENGEKVRMPRRIIRTTAAVQQGNSGGGLFNGTGELIGIVQSKPFYTGTLAQTGVIQSGNLPIDNIAYAVPTDIAVRIAKQMAERDRAGEFPAGGSYNRDCLKMPAVGVILGAANKRVDPADTSAVYYIEDIFVDEITAACGVDFETNDIIRWVECGGRRLDNITAIYQIREFLIECYDEDEITFCVAPARGTEQLILTGEFASVTIGGERPPAQN